MGQHHPPALNTPAKHLGTCSHRLTTVNLLTVPAPGTLRDPYAQKAVSSRWGHSLLGIHRQGSNPCYPPSRPMSLSTLLHLPGSQLSRYRARLMFGHPKAIPGKEGTGDTAWVIACFLTNSLQAYRIKV